MNRYKQREDSFPLPGAAYIRFSSEMQRDSFNLDAQLRQIKEQAERDGFVWMIPSPELRKATEVKIALPVPHGNLKSVKEHEQ